MQEAAEAGLIDTVIKKCKPSKVAEKIAGTKTIMAEINKETKKKMKHYEDSEENKIRSIAVYYSGGVMGKTSTVLFIEIVVINK